MSDISFRKAEIKDESLILSWLAEQHVMEFWDNSKEHKEDIKNFLYGYKQTYFAGTTNYYLGFIDNIPFSFILSDILSYNEDLPILYKKHMSRSGTTIALDFCIGNKDFLGHGLASSTLNKFIIFYHNEIDNKANRFFIDPDGSNPKAIHVYEKAGFKMVGNFRVEKGAFVGHNSKLMIYNLPE